MQRRTAVAGTVEQRLEHSGPAGPESASDARDTLTRVRTNPVSLPEGTYVSFASAVRSNKGGRTGVVIMRANALAELGARSVIATVGSVPDQEEERAALVARGALLESVEVVNIFLDYRQRDPEAFGRGSGAPTSLPGGLVGTDEALPDGTPYRTLYHRPGQADPVVIDYRRPDGSLFLRWSTHDRTRIELVDHDGRVVHRHRRRGRFVRSWLREIVSDGDGFIITDSRKLLPMLLGFRSRRMHVLAAFHNPHIEGEARWDKTVRPPFLAVLEQLPALAGLVLLTERQRDEIARRWGHTDNLFVVPNPVVPPTLPDPLPPRDPHRLVVVARLEGQKRIGHVLKALSIAQRTNPELRLDVYGDGAARPALEKQAHDLGIADAVTFHGYDPAARESLLTASAFLMTSKHEGYPLATLEAMSRGCPVISYDIKFGPREQIDDGVDGFLVEDGDIESFAQRILEITSDPERTAAMSAGALAKAAAHSPQRFAEDCARMFRTVKEQQRTRLRLEAARLDQARLRDSAFSGRLSLKLRPEVDPEQLTISLDVIGEDTGEVVSFPVTARRRWFRRTGLRMSARLDTAPLARTLGDQPARARLLLVARNVTWQAPLGEGRVSRGRFLPDGGVVSAG